MMTFITIAAFAVGVLGLIWAVAMYLRVCDLEGQVDRLSQSLANAVKTYDKLDREFAKYQRAVRDRNGVATVSNRIDRFM